MPLSLGLLVGHSRAQLVAYRTMIPTPLPPTTCPGAAIITIIDERHEPPPEAQRSSQHVMHGHPLEQVAVEIVLLLLSQSS